ncbi:MAG: tetratricopeptide repeat protein [Candidatus Omnitrophica bacterium]|nr:tetratricopeptide repeat protein [Candidatus Omnitrophota bacterium]
MNDPHFTELRCQIDNAITFHDLAGARSLIVTGLELAQRLECLGEVMYFRAQGAIIDERFTEALELLNQALAFNPADGAAYNDMALCMLELGRIDGVLEVFDHGIAVEPDYATIHHNKGWFLNKIGRPTEALACFRQALAFAPQRVVTWENMANACEELGLPAQALEAYQKALFYLKDADTGIGAQLRAEIARLELVVQG